MTTAQDYADLGLEPPICDHWLTRRNRECGQPVVSGEDKCVYHGGGRLLLAANVREFREQISENIVPVAINRLMDILLDEDAMPNDVIRAAFGLMDRVGMGPVQGIQIEGNLNVQSPLTAIQGLLTAVASRLPQQVESGLPVLDAEEVVDKPEE